MSRWDAEALRRQARRRRVTRKARRWHDFVLRMDKVGGQVDAVNEQTAEAIQSLERLQQMRISTPHRPDGRRPAPLDRPRGDPMKMYHPTLPDVTEDYPDELVDRAVIQGWKKTEPKAVKEAREAAEAPAAE